MPPVAGPPTTAGGNAPFAGAAPVDVGRIEVDAVEAARPKGRVAGRIIAAGAAALMLGGGGFLLVNAASSQSGAASPEAAFEAAMAAVENEDLIALAEIMEPSERDTVFEAGFDFVDELVRLEVLDPAVDLSAIAGIDLEFEGFEPRVERPGNGLAHVYFGEGTVSGSIDVSSMPLGPFLTERMDAEQLTMTDSGEEPAGPSSSPLVAVERDGRWYLSLWYTVAENIRIEVDAALPDPGLRPAQIGGSTPEAAVRQMFADAVQLDLRRMIGSLDPEEMAVLYDYAPLFLDDVDSLANEVLTAAADAGWSWELVDLGLTSEVDGTVATVRMNAMHFLATADNGGEIDVQIGEDQLAINVVMIDEFYGDRYSMSMELNGECLDMTIDEGTGPTSERLCGEDLGLGSASGLTEFGNELDTLAMVTREVDGVWYISPMRTGLDAIVTAIEQVDPESLEEFADAVLDLGLSTEFGTDDLAFGLPGSSDDVFDDDLFGSDDGSSFEYDPLQGMANRDLLPGTLEPDFAYDVDASGAAQELDFWAPELAEGPFSRGAYYTVPGASGGTVAVTVVELTDVDAMVARLPAYLEANGLPTEPWSAGTVYEGTDSFDDPVFVAIADDRLVVIGVYGASAEDARSVMELQLWN